MRTEAQLQQIRTWLKEAPDKPARVLPLIASMVAMLTGEIEDRTAMLADEQGRSQEAGSRGSFWPAR
jgi:hypothetical protein